jgi:hypothetical protein
MVRDLATKNLSMLFDLWLNEKAMLWTLGTVPAVARKYERLMVVVGAMGKAVLRAIEMVRESGPLLDMSLSAA